MNQAIEIVIGLLDVYRWVLLVTVVLSWVNPDPYNPIVRFLRQATDPVLTPLRRLLMPLTRQLLIDFSPILAFLGIGLVQSVLRRVQYGGLNPQAVAVGFADGVIVFFAFMAAFLGGLFVARVVIEATNADRFNPLVRFVYMVTDPIVFRFRLRVRRGGVDPRPVLAALVMLAAYFLLQTLRTLF
jgi:YggT family protein